MIVFESTKNIELNSLGQFVLGNWNRINYKETLKFIKENDSKAVNFYKEHVELTRKESSMKEDVMSRFELKDLRFNERLSSKQKMQTMDKLLELAYYKNKDIHVLKTFKKADHLFIGESYALNEDSSVTIPWNWFEFKKNND